MFCQYYYMDYMKAEFQKKHLVSIDQKRDRFLDFINTIGTKDMKRVLKNPEVYSLMNGMMGNGKKVKIPIERPKAKKCT